MTKTNRDKLLADFGERICQFPHDVTGVGVACYGPIISVSLEDKMRAKRGYGRISDKSSHRTLAGFDVYTVLTEALEDHRRRLPIVIQTDVSCGAVHQAHMRSFRGFGLEGNYRRHRLRDVLAFVHLAEGVGGSFVQGFEPWIGALHCEMGYVAAQPIAADSWGKKIYPKRRMNQSPVFIERLVSISSVLGRSGAKTLAAVPVEDWEYTSSYIAQLCSAITTMIGPHQIILGGRLVDEARDEDGSPLDIVEMVKERFSMWLDAGEGKGSYIYYGPLEEIESYIDGIRGVDGESDRAARSMMAGAILVASRSCELDAQT